MQPSSFPTSSYDVKLWVGQGGGPSGLKHQPDPAGAAHAEPQEERAQTAQGAGASVGHFDEKGKETSHADLKENDGVRSAGTNGGGGGGEGEGDANNESDGDDDDKGCLHEASTVAQNAVREVTHRLDFLVGVACLTIALWLRVSRTNKKDGRASGLAPACGSLTWDSVVHHSTCFAVDSAQHHPLASSHGATAY